MLTETMRRAGWRECPSDEVRRAWEAKGGRWQIVCHLRTGGLSAPSTPMFLCINEFTRKVFWRPVSTQTWDYDPRGWGVVVPTEPNDGTGELWWYRLNSGTVLLCYVYGGEVEIIMFGDDRWEHYLISLPNMWSAFHGEWIAPCVKPEVMP